MSAARLLDQDILEAFDAALSEHAPAVRENLAHPGLSESEICAQFEAPGMRVSAEALAWWRYFQLPVVDLERPHFEVLPTFQFLPVECSVEWYRLERGFAEENAGDWGPARADEAWHRHWVPIFFISTGGKVVLDCRGEPRDPSPLRSVRPDTVFSPEHASVFAPSLGELLARPTKWWPWGHAATNLSASCGGRSRRGRGSWPTAMRSRALKSEARSACCPRSLSRMT